MCKKYISVLTMIAMAMSAAAQTDTLQNSLSRSLQVEVGANRTFTLEETTGAVSVITGNQIDRRTAKNIGNDILGLGSGLQSLQNAGLYQDVNPTFYVRGLQTLNGNDVPLILVDGIERDIAAISPEEVESVQILKDAPATALYGYRAINGAVLITTKRGKKDSREIVISYDHAYNHRTHTPKFLDGYNYGLAINEARAFDGLTPRYSDNELQALRNGSHPELYPNVDWVGETFRNVESVNKFNVQFRGGTEKFRYYALANLITTFGFIKNPNQNAGYSTQDKYSKGNIRMNFDIDLTPTTLVKLNVFGTLTERQRPGNQADIWDMVYTVPSAAFPVKSLNGMWGGSTTWAGTLNPVGQSVGAAYYKNHYRALFTDLTIRQDLGMVTPGLSAQIGVSYDSQANIYEDHSKTYQYEVLSPSWPAGQAEPTYTSSIQGTDSEMASGSGANTWNRYLTVNAAVNYERTFGDLSLYSQLKWDFSNIDPNGINNTVYRQTISWFSHLSYRNRYLLDLTLAEMGSSRLAPGTKWSFSPTVGLGWVVSNEDFWTSDQYLKIRATFGKLNADFLPFDSWTYYAQQYETSGLTYPFTSSWGSSFGQTNLGQMATSDPKHEQAYKYNVGVDYSPIQGLNVSFDYWAQRRNNIWVSAAGKYTAVIGMEAPYENGGVVDSHGVEVALDYTKKIGDWQLDFGGSFNYSKTKIVDMLEEPRLYPNLVQTGNRVGQIYGLEAIGFFKDQADIAASPEQLFSTVRPGDIKYRDINGDNVIDANDVTAIGYTSSCPEIYYNFRLGAEYKGIGLYAVFQGTGNYTALLTTKAMYRPLVGNVNISQYYYDNRWTPEHQDALFPALSSVTNSNNTQTSTLWMRNRSFLKLRDLQIYYNVPSAWLRSTIKFMKEARVYVSATDLFSTSNVPENDPECYGIYPVNRSINFGVKVTF